MPQLYQTLKSGNGHCPTGQLPVREVVDAVYDRAIDVDDRAYLSRHARITADGLPSCATEKKKRAVIDRAYNLPHRQVHSLSRARAVFSKDPTTLAIAELDIDRPSS